jgi:hypothetical protein
MCGSTKFPLNYPSHNVMVVVSECYDEGEWSMDFRRPLTLTEMVQWELLLDKSKNVRLNETDAKWYRNWKKMGCFSTKTMYICLMHRGGHQQTEYITNENQNFYAADHARIEFNLGKL